jgi:hypothetical protein
MSTGAVLQLAAYGAQDLYLTGNPQITHFKSVVKRNTNFAIETIENYFDGKIAPGQKISCKLQRVGDLLSQIYLNLRLPALQKIQGENNIYTSWVNGIGFAIIDYIDIQIGEQVIDRHYGQWMFIWAELTEESAKRGGLAGMVGGHDVFTPATQNGPLQLYIPFYFWFCRDLGSSLPLVSLQLQNVYISIQFRAFETLWVSNNKELAREQLCYDGTTEFTQANLLTDYIFLDNDERRFFAQNRHFYLIEQLQMVNQSIDINKEENVIELPFNHPVKELIWTIQGDNVRRLNKWFNYTADTSDDPVAPLESAVIRFEGTERFEERKERYFRLVEPWKKHTATPNNFIYVYSFASKPEKLQPSGTANFSRIDTATLHLKTGDISDSQVTIYATNYNIFRIIGGISGVLFSN